MESTQTAGLSHLVEAATALANFVKPQEKPQINSIFHQKQTESTIMKTIVSDEEGRKSPTARSSIGMSNAKREIFPQRLMAILNDPSLSDIITWLPHGRSFVIIRPDVFTEKVLPNYLPPVDARGSTKYPSFTRKLNRWGFRQATRGPDTGAFHHKLFRRDQPDLCLEMICQRSRDRKGECAKSGKSIGSQQRSLPPKKRMSGCENESDKIASLTKESLATILPAEDMTCTRGPAATSVSVTDDSRSTTSTSNSSTGIEAPAAPTLSLGRPPVSVATRLPLLNGISSDQAFVQATLRKRDEMERLKVAKAMLYHSFLQALNGE